MSRNLYVNLLWRFLRARAPYPYRERVLPMKLTVASTFMCNHRCKLCNIWCVYRDNAHKRSEELTPDDFARIFTDIRGSLLFLDWGGGEPFLRDDMCEIIGRAARICPKLSSFVITTNGLLSDRIGEWVDRLAASWPRHRFSVGVSLDGDERTHDYMRGKEGAFRGAVATIGRLLALGGKHKNLEVKVSYTLCSINAGQFGDFHRTVLAPLGIGVGDVAFNVEHVGNLFQTGGTETVKAGQLRGEEHRAKIGEDIRYALAQIRAEKLPRIQRLKSFYRTFFLESVPGYLAHPGKMVIPCQAARNSLYLDPYGTFYPCVVWDKQLGSFRDGMSGLLESEWVTNVRKTIDREKCPVCWNACEAIPSLLTSWRLVGCAVRSLGGR